VVKETGVVVGLGIATQIFALLDPAFRCTAEVEDGMVIEAGLPILSLEGSARSLLMGERLALNFMQRLSGIATLTRRYVEAIADLRTEVVDTRKTTPGLRLLEKYAVRMGGARNHRFNLSDAAMLKDNHIALAGGITAAMARVKAQVPITTCIEVECESLAMVQEAVSAGAGLIMLDNMTPEAIREAVEWVAGRARLEASGGVSLETIRAIAETGVDYISVGRLTHSAPALDISLDVSGD
jgi:nicotinate-nucleotide pyrophosphorylase (carboxylating)